MSIDSDVMFYADEDKVIQAIKNLVESQNSIAEKFEYIEHELVFSEPTLVEGLLEEIQKLVSSELHIYTEGRLVKCQPRD